MQVLPKTDKVNFSIIAAGLLPDGACVQLRGARTRSIYNPCVDSFWLLAGINQPKTNKIFSGKWIITLLRLRDTAALSLTNGLGFNFNSNFTTGWNTTTRKLARSTNTGLCCDCQGSKEEIFHLVASLKMDNGCVSWFDGFSLL